MEFRGSLYRRTHSSTTNCAGFCIRFPRVDDLDACRLDRGDFARGCRGLAMDRDCRDRAVPKADGASPAARNGPDFARQKRGARIEREQSFREQGEDILQPALEIVAMPACVQLANASADFCDCDRCQYRASSACRSSHARTVGGESGFATSEITFASGTVTADPSVRMASGHGPGRCPKDRLRPAGLRCGSRDRCAIPTPGCFRESRGPGTPRCGSAATRAFNSQ